MVPLDQDPCGEHIKSMPYLKACLKESMRYSRTGTAGTLRAITRVTSSNATHLADNLQESQDFLKPQAAQY